jgi:diguanylate cyclase (GGDEF)-like protein
MVGRTLGATAREADFVGRWGGEEFLAIVEADVPEQLSAAAERFRRMVESCSLEREGGPVCVTLSLGGAIARAGEAAPSLLERADGQLYRSKREGRNRLSIAA